MHELKCLFYFFVLNLLWLSSEDPWSSSGYSGMLSNSPHIGQPGSFPPINPQDRMVNRNFLLEVLAALLQKLSSLLFSLQSYPLHGSEVNGFHSAPTTYNHTPTINGEGIMGKNPFDWTFHRRVFQAAATDLFIWNGFILFKNKLSVHLTGICYLMSAASRGTTASSSGDEIGKALASVSCSLFLL